jgi:hypothetical protein
VLYQFDVDAAGLCNAALRLLTVLARRSASDTV